MIIQINGKDGWSLKLKGKLMKKDDYIDYMIIYSNCGRKIIDANYDDGDPDFAPYLGADFITIYIFFNTINVKKYNNSAAKAAIVGMHQKLRLVCWAFKCGETGKCDATDRILTIKFKNKKAD